MKKTSILWLAALFLISGYEASANIKAFTKQCETDVSAFCALPTKGTCSRYCVAANKKKPAQDTCKTHCTAAAYCNKAGHAGTPDALAKQNKEQVIACIAQLRDPSGENSGRRMEDWKVIQTPSFTKVVGEPVADAADADASDEPVAKKRKVAADGDENANPNTAAVED